MSRLSFRGSCSELPLGLVGKPMYTSCIVNAPLNACVSLVATEALRRDRDLLLTIDLYAMPTLRSQLFLEIHARVMFVASCQWAELAKPPNLLLQLKL